MQAECKLNFLVRSQLLFNSSWAGFKEVDYIRKLSFHRCQILAMKAGISAFNFTGVKFSYRRRALARGAPPRQKLARNGKGVERIQRQIN